MESTSGLEKSPRDVGGLRKVEALGAAGSLRGAVVWAQQNVRAVCMGMRIVYYLFLTLFFTFFFVLSAFSLCSEVCSVVSRS